MLIKDFSLKTYNFVTEIPNAFRVLTPVILQGVVFGIKALALSLTANHIALGILSTFATVFALGSCSLSKINITTLVKGSSIAFCKSIPTPIATPFMYVALFCIMVTDRKPFSLITR